MSIASFLAVFDGYRTADLYFVCVLTVTWYNRMKKSLHSFPRVSSACWNLLGQHRRSLKTPIYMLKAARNFSGWDLNNKSTSNCAEEMSKCYARKLQVYVAVLSANCTPRVCNIYAQLPSGSGAEPFRHSSVRKNEHAILVDNLRHLDTYPPRVIFEKLEK